MRHLTHIYKNPEQFREFVGNVKIRSGTEILVQVFTGIVSPDHIREIQKLVRDTLPGAKMIGCTTAGEISDAHTLEHSTVISVSIFDSTIVNTALAEGSDHFNIGKKIAAKLCDEDTVLAICLTAGIHEDMMLSGQDFCAGFNSVCSTTPIAGGLSGDNAMFIQGYIFDLNTIAGNGAVVATLDSKNLIATSCFNLGWRPLGREFTITAAEDTRIITLNDEPAADVFERYFGIYAGSGATKGFVFPLYTVRNGMRIARGIISVNPDRSLSTTASLECGDKVRFSYGGAQNLHDTCVKLAAHWRNIDAEAIFIYSCACRKWNLPQIADEEVKLLYHDIPAAGFFSYGEYFHTGVKGEFLNFTQTLIALKEEKQAANGRFTILREVDLNPVADDSNIIKADNIQHNLRVLDQLVAAMTEEMMVLNRELQQKNAELQHSLEHIKTMQGLIPICASCKKIRDDQGYWHQVEAYIRNHTDAKCSHSVCPECFAKLYPDVDPDTIFKPKK